MTAITFDSEFPGGIDLSYALVKVELDTGGLGPGFVDGVELVGVHKFNLNAAGEGGINLPGTDVIEPAGSVWCIDVESYDVRLSFADGAGPYSWADPAIQAPPGAAPVAWTPPTVIDADVYGVDVPGGLMGYDTGQLEVMVDPRRFGAACDGVTDDTTALNDAIAAVSTNGGTVVFTGTLGISDLVDIPGYVNLVGIGGGVDGVGDYGVSSIKALHADAQIRFGNTGIVRGGISGNFTIDGDEVAGGTTGGLLHIEHAVHRQFQCIEVGDSVGDGIVVDRAQNCTFTQVKAVRCEGDTFVVDRGAGNNTFLGCGARRAGGALLRFGINDGGAGTGGASTFSNWFYKGIFETAFATDMEGAVVHEDGRGNGLHGVNLVCGDTINGTAAENAGCVVQCLDGSLMLDGCRINGGTVNDAVYVGQDAQVVCDMLTTQNAVSVFRVDDTGILRQSNTFGSYTDLFDFLGSASNVNIDRAEPVFFQLDPAFTYWQQMYVEGDTTARLAFAIDASGARIEIGPGNAARDVSLTRQAANHWRTPDHFEALLGLRTYVKVGSPPTNADFTGAGMAAAPGSGTIAVEDTGTGVLWVKVGTTWRSVALT
jgi:hypothetical protein